MGDRHERKCEGRQVRGHRRWQGDAPFLGRGRATCNQQTNEGAPNGEHHVLPEQEEEADKREITMIVFRDGKIWEAAADIQTDDEGSMDWLASAIAALDNSVDMAIADS